MGGTKPKIRHPLTCYATLGGIEDSGVCVKASCDRCGLSKAADIPALIQKLGREGTLVDRFPPCPTEGCKGRVLFSYSTGRSTMFKPMATGRRLVLS